MACEAVRPSGAIPPTALRLRAPPVHAATGGYAVRGPQPLRSPGDGRQAQKPSVCVKIASCRTKSAQNPGICVKIAFRRTKSAQNPGICVKNGSKPSVLTRKTRFCALLKTPAGKVSFQRQHLALLPASHGPTTSSTGQGPQHIIRPCPISIHRESKRPILSGTGLNNEITVFVYYRNILWSSNKKNC